jgi:hypothetical protein
MSNLYKLQAPDWVKGLVTTVIGAVLVTLEQAITTGGFSAIDWKMVGGIALTTGISYLVKNFFSDSEGKVLGVIG